MSGIEISGKEHRRSTSEEAKKVRVRKKGASGGKVGGGYSERSVRRFNVDR